MKRLIKNKIIVHTIQKICPINRSNRYINLGGGNWYYPHWENIDLKANKLFTTYRIDLDSQVSLPFYDNTVQIIFIQNMIYYLKKENVQHLFEECYRVLKNDGLIHISITDGDSIFGNEVMDTMSNVKTRFTFSLLSDMLKKEGFKNIQRIGFRQSQARVLRGRWFDRVPNRNIYVEGIK